MRVKTGHPRTKRVESDSLLKTSFVHVDRFCRFRVQGFP